MKISPLKPSDESAALELMSACFAGEPTEYFTSYHRLLAQGRPEVQLVAEIDGRLVGYLECQWREHYFGDQTLPAANIGALCTHPDFRRRGVARGLLEAALAMIDPERHPVTGLHASVPELFAEHGFSPVAHAQLVAKLPDRETVPSRGTSFEPVTAEDFDELFDLYRRENRQLLGPIVRSRRYFNGQHAWMSQLPRELHWETMRQVGRSVGYLRYQVDLDHLEVLEVVASGRERGGAAAARLLQVARAAGVERIDGRISPRAPFVSALARLTEIEIRQQAGLMFRINDLDGLLAAIGAHISARRRAIAVPAAAVNLDIAGQVRSLSFPPAQAVFGPPIDGVPKIALTHGQFLALVFGCEGGGSALQSADLRIDTRTQLATAFPEDGWVLWQADHY